MDIISCTSQYCLSKILLKGIKNIRNYLKLQTHIQSKIAIALYGH